MYVSSEDGCTKDFGKSYDACAPEIDTDAGADESDGEVASDADRGNRVTTSQECLHRPWLVPGAGRL
jgi:hypothetical protein